MSTFTSYDAKARFSALLDRVEQDGETIVITRHGKPVAKVVPYKAPAWDPVWEPDPGLRVALNEDPSAPTFPRGVPWHDGDPL